MENALSNNLPFPIVSTGNNSASLEKYYGSTCTLVPFVSWAVKCNREIGGKVMSQKKKKSIYIYTYINIYICINQTLSSGGIGKSSPTQDIHWST